MRISDSDFLVDGWHYASGISEKPGVLHTCLHAAAPNELLRLVADCPGLCARRREWHLSSGGQKRHPVASRSRAVGKPRCPLGQRSALFCAHRHRYGGATVAPAGTNASCASAHQMWRGDSIQLRFFSPICFPPGEGGRIGPIVGIRRGGPSLPPHNSSL